MLPSLVVKGTVSVISSDPPCRDCNARLDIYNKSFLKVFAKVTSAFLASKKQWINKNFLSRKNDGIFHIFDPIKVSRVPL